MTKFYIKDTIFILMLIISVMISCNNKQKILPNAHKIYISDTSLNRKHDTKLTYKIDTLFKSFCENTKFNGVVLVAKEQNIIYENKSGYSNFKNKKLITTKSVFQIASISKQFTAMAIMILNEQQKLNYDDSIQKYIPNFPYKGITIKMLLTHRSGLSNYMYFCDKYTNKETTIYNKDVLKFIIDSIPEPYYPPNYTYDYCNTNYVLLALIVEIISNQSFTNFMQENIFIPLKMNDTYIYIKDIQTRIPNSTTGYHYRWLKALPIYIDGAVGDKGIYTTVEDLYRWDKALYTSKLIEYKNLIKAFEPGSPEKKGKKNYGFGWRLIKCDSTNRLIYHGGWWRGHNSIFVRDTTNKLTIILLSNSRNRQIYSLFKDIYKIINLEAYTNCFETIGNINL